MANEHEQNKEVTEEEVVEPEVVEKTDTASSEDVTTEEPTEETTEGETKDDDPKAALEAELQETKDRFLRLQAEYDNFRRRTKQEKEAAAKYRSQALVEGLLPVVDNFERALQVDVSDDNEQGQSLLKGMDMVYQQLKEALENEGVTPIDEVGQPFDPTIHQAVAQAPSEEYESNTVINIMQKGYKLKDRVVRPAMVQVSE